MKHVRTIFISDVHLGIKDCKIDLLLQFLKDYQADTYFLVGDIIDAWALRRRFFWTDDYNKFFRKLLKRAKEGATIYYIPGNHDEFAREFLDVSLGANIHVVNQTIFQSLSGKRFYVTHGDQFDIIMQTAHWLMLVGDWVYAFLLQVNSAIGWVRRKLNMDYWSFSAWAKTQTKKAIAFIKDFEHAMIVEAKRAGCSGVISGHIHHPQIKETGGVTYVNLGDWVENCSALVEHEDGSLELVFSK